MPMEANYRDQYRRNPRRVLSEAGEATKGYACMYNMDYGTAANVDPERHKRVEAPSVTNNRFFAGVHSQALTRSQTTKIWEPGRGGSVAQCYIGEAVTLNDRVSVDYATGKFYKGGLSGGRGAGTVMQTLTEAGLADVLLDEGVGECDGNAGVFNITPEAAGGAIVLSQRGMNLINGGTINDDHATFTLADGVETGQKVGFKITTLVGNSKNVVVTVTTGVQADLATNLATITLNAADEIAILEWLGAEWVLRYYAGATLSS